MLREIHLAEDLERRGALYEGLKGALFSGEAGVKQRLRLFALERWEVEKADPDAVGLVHYPLLFLLHLGEPGLAERIRQARGLCERGIL